MFCTLPPESSGAMNVGVGRAGSAKTALLVDGAAEDPVGGPWKLGRTEAQWLATVWEHASHDPGLPQSEVD